MKGCRVARPSSAVSDEGLHCPLGACGRLMACPFLCGDELVSNHGMLYFWAK